jgi:uncharacterized protein YbgA (DUF1722 family)/uncharacterized protein YbbK (DUF523 family)
MTDAVGKVRLGVSACLLGENVRYDGQHKLDRYIRDTLGRYVEFVPVCPEAECGLGVPRESMRLVGDPAAPRLVTTRSDLDLTDRMLAWAERRVDELEREGLHGFIFKAKSPSSGMERVKVFNAKGGVIGKGAGLFARKFMERYPLLPVEDEGRLSDPDLRENFIERVFTLQRYRAACAPSETGRRRLGRVMEFHARNKLLIMAHNESRARALGTLLANAESRQAQAVCEIYEADLLRALTTPATPRRHVNVLQHIAGYFKKNLDAREKEEMQGLIRAFGAGLIPLIVPVTMLSHYAEKYAVAYLLDQCYLRPHPLELKLRNHA